MSARALQQVVVRMHFSPRFAAEVIAGRAALSDEVTAEERALLTRLDARAFRADRYRQDRLIAALVDEAPVTAAVLGAAATCAFVDSDAFAAVVAGHEVAASELVGAPGPPLSAVAAAFLTWAATRAGGFAIVELAAARARRRVRVTRTPLGPGQVVRAPGVDIARLPAATLDAYAAARAALGAQPLAALFDGVRVSPSAPSDEPEYLLVAPGAGGEELSLVPADAFRVLSRLGQPLDLELLLARHLLDADARDLVDALVAEGLVLAG